MVIDEIGLEYQRRIFSNSNLPQPLRLIMNPSSRTFYETVTCKF